MPTVLRIGPFRFHLDSDEGNEPPHIRSPDGECKFWLDPGIVLAANRGVPAHDLRKIEQLVYEHHESLTKAFHEFHSR